MEKKEQVVHHACVVIKLILISLQGDITDTRVGFFFGGGGGGGGGGEGKGRTIHLPPIL